MVYDLVKAHEASDDNDNFRPEHKKRSGAIRTREFVVDVAEVIKVNPSKSMRKSPRKWN